MSPFTTSHYSFDFTPSSSSPNLVIGCVTWYSTPSITTVSLLVSQKVAAPLDEGTSFEGRIPMFFFRRNRTCLAIARHAESPVERIPPTVTQLLEQKNNIRHKSVKFLYFFITSFIIWHWSLDLQALLRYFYYLTIVKVLHYKKILCVTNHPGAWPS